MGCWSDQLGFSSDRVNVDFYLDADWNLHESGSAKHYTLKLNQHGRFNALNATAAIIAARHAGVPIETSVEALQKFNGVKRRQEIIAEIDGIRIVDDFAHHPTAIALTLNALKDNTPGRLFAVLDIRSNTMKMGKQAGKLGQALTNADQVLLCENPDLQWDIREMAKSAPVAVEIKTDIQEIIDFLVNNCERGDQIVILSNGGFDNIHHRLIQAMQT